MRRRLELLLAVAALRPVSAKQSCTASASLEPTLCSKQHAPSGFIGDVDYSWDCTSATEIELGQIVPLTIRARNNCWKEVDAQREYLTGELEVRGAPHARHLAACPTHRGRGAHVRRLVRRSWSSTDAFPAAGSAGAQLSRPASSSIRACTTSRSRPPFQTVLLAGAVLLSLWPTAAAA